MHTLSKPTDCISLHSDSGWVGVCDELQISPREGLTGACVNYEATVKLIWQTEVFLLSIDWKRNKRAKNNTLKKGPKPTQSMFRANLSRAYRSRAYLSRAYRSRAHQSRVNRSRAHRSRATRSRAHQSRANRSRTTGPEPTDPEPTSSEPTWPEPSKGSCPIAVQS